MFVVSARILCHASVTYGDHSRLPFEEGVIVDIFIETIKKTYVSSDWKRFELIWLTLFEEQLTEINVTDLFIMLLNVFFE